MRQQQGWAGPKKREKEGSDYEGEERPLLDDGLRRYDVQRVFIPCPGKKLEKTKYFEKSLNFLLSC